MMSRYELLGFVFLLICFGKISICSYMSIDGGICSGIPHGCVSAGHRGLQLCHGAPLHLRCHHQRDRQHPPPPGDGSPD